MFDNINNPEPFEIKIWLKEVKLTIDQASNALGISKRQFSRFLSGDTRAKKVHALAMQMVWLVEEKNKDLIEERKNMSKKEIIKIQIK
ncbi:hypothetical protein OA848_05785 [Rickettsiales bacterium]|nr:hypothetical protein [Rickettsiales bacterium]